MEIDRQELLNRLYSLPFCMQLTVLPNEYCVEVNVVSSRGTSYKWEGYDEFDFTAYCLKGLSKNKVEMIKDHIVSKSLFLSDLNRTELKKIIPVSDKTIELSELFVDFVQLPDERIEDLYCYVDPETGKIYVSDKPEGISTVLNDIYPIDTPWESLGDEDLKAYLEEYEDSECEIPFSHF